MCRSIEKGEIEKMKKYVSPEVKIEKFQMEDIVTASDFGKEFQSDNDASYPEAWK